MILGRRFSSRELALAGFSMLSLVGVLAFHWWVSPAISRWTFARDAASASDEEYDRLRGFLEVSGPVADAYGDLPEEVFQDASEQITMSRFLRRIESLARRPGMVIVNASPQPIEGDELHRMYPVQISVSGGLPPIVAFVQELLSGPWVVGVSGYSLQASRSGRNVECSLDLWMVTLTERIVVSEGEG